MIPSLLDGGLGLLLRWALDESSQVSIVASIGALHALLVCEEDEVSGQNFYPLIVVISLICFSRTRPRQSF